MARVSLVPVWVILSLLCCFCASFVASLSAPVRGYQHSYSSEQTQSYDSETGAFSSVTVTSRQCNVIKRMTQYETVRVPFLCQVATGRVVPLPPDMESPNRDQILSAMQAGGWSICYQPITVPIYRYQRIPVCCPGTTPTRDGRCICKKEVQDPVVVPAPGQLLNSNSKMHSDQKPPVYPGYEYKPAPATPIRVQPPRPYRGILGHVPPGNIKPNSLLQQVTLAGTQGGPSYTVTNDRGPNPYNPVAPQYYPRGSSPPQLVRPSPLRPLATPGGEGVEWQGDIARYLAAMMYQKLLVEQQEKILQEEISRQLRLRQQMELILDHQRQVAQIHHHHQQQQQQQQQWLQPPRGRYPTLSSRPPPNPLPRPLPSPPTKMTPTTVPQQGGEESTAAPEAAASDTDTDTDITTTTFRTTTPTPISDRDDLQGQEGDGGSVGGRPGETLEETLQGDNTGATHTAATAVDDADDAAAAAAAPQLGNRPPSNIPPGPQGVPPEVLQMRERVKKIVDDCLKSSGIGSPMEAILQSGDLDQLRPVCRASDTVGPCVMQSVESSLGQDQMGMVGRQMMQSIFVSLGQLCTKLEEADKKANNSPPADDITSPPVFPNPAPSVTQQVVTEGTVEISNSGDNSAATDNNNNGINNNNNDNNNDNVKPEVDTPQDSSNTEAQPLLTVRKESPSEHKTAGDHSPMDMPPLAAAADTPSSIISGSVGAQAHSAKEKKTERETDGAAFPLWMILAMVGACSAVLLFSCLTICLVLRCRRKKKTLDLEREPEKLPVPVPAEGNIYAASPCHPPPSYATTAVRQTLGGGEEEEEEVEEDLEFKIPEDVELKKEKGDSSVEKALPAAGDGEEEGEEEEKKEKEEEEEK